MFKRLMQLLLGVIGLSSGGCKPAVLSPAQFAAEFADAVKKASPEVAGVKVIQGFELEIEFKSGQKITSYLDNAYAEYKLTPKEKTAIIDRFVASNLASFASLSSESQRVDPKCIVPMVKAAIWLENSKEAAIQQGAKDPNIAVWEPLNEDLVIVYAEDDAANIHFMNPERFAQSGIEKTSLRKLASENLLRLLPKLKLVGGNGIYGVAAGGNYEASLLAVDSVWTKEKFDVQGDFVVAVPNRDMLLVTGSQNAQGLEKLREVAQKSSRENPYPLTSNLFVRRNGQWLEFKE
jgi:uncharacterized protein YtpQ (UPF0354 family)